MVQFTLLNYCDRLILLSKLQNYFVYPFKTFKAACFSTLGSFAERHHVREGKSKYFESL